MIRSCLITHLIITLSLIISYHFYTLVLPSPNRWFPRSYSFFSSFFDSYSLPSFFASLIFYFFFILTLVLPIIGHHNIALSSLFFFFIPILPIFLCIAIFYLLFFTLVLPITGRLIITLSSLLFFFYSYSPPIFLSIFILFILCSAHNKKVIVLSSFSFFLFFRLRG